MNVKNSFLLNKFDWIDDLCNGNNKCFCGVSVWVFDGYCGYGGISALSSVKRRRVVDE